VRDAGNRLMGIWRENWLFLLVVAAVVMVFALLRTPGSPVGSVAEVDVLLQGGQPALVEFYSNT
jgi:hypothetical protein